MNYEIIPITENHIEGYHAALDSVARERKYLAFLEAPEISSTRDFVLENIEKNLPHFVAIHENKVIGWCDISPLNRPVYAHTGSLGMGVLSEYRGKKIGSALLTATLAKAKSLALTRIELEVREQNHPAIALYKKFNFKTEGTKQNSTLLDGNYSNDLIMALLF